MESSQLSVPVVDRISLQPAVCSQQQRRLKKKEVEGKSKKVKNKNAKRLTDYTQRANRKLNITKQYKI